MKALSSSIWLGLCLTFAAGAEAADPQEILARAKTASGGAGPPAGHCGL